MSDDNLKEIITRQLLEEMGEIKDLRQIRMRNVFDRNWRVDIFCYYDDPTLMSSVIRPTRIKYSYFIRVDESGNIIKSDPEIGEEQEDYSPQKLPTKRQF